MRFVLAFAALALMPGIAAAQTDQLSPSVAANPDNWQSVRTETGINYVHKASGAICIDNFRGIPLVQIQDYAPDGTNSGCQYDQATSSGTTRVSLYIYTGKDLTGPDAYRGAKESIMQMTQSSGLKAVELPEAGQQCFQGVMPALGAAMRERNGKDGIEEDKITGGLGVSIYDFSIPEVNGRPAQNLTSLLSVYQTGKWIVKVRLTAPKTETSIQDACNMAGRMSVAEAKVISRKTDAANPAG